MVCLRLLLAITAGAMASSCSSSDSSNGSSAGDDSGTAPGSSSSKGASGSSGSSGPSPSYSSGSGGSTSGDGSTSSGSSASNGDSGSSSGSSGGSGSSGSREAGDSGPFTGPCDIYGSGGTPCVAAHSTVRALYANYRGNLYQVTRASDHTTKDIGLLITGDFADGAAQDAFCSGTTCVTSAIYDQSGKGNDLWYQGSSLVPGSTQSSAATATTEPLHPSGNKVYSLYINPGNSYWRNGSQSGVPTGSQPEGLYMVTSGTHYNAGCCFDYGNSETDRKADGAGAMDAINFGNECWFSSTAPCTRSGPWVQADLEYGLWAGGSQSTNPDNVPMTNKYVTAMLKNNGTTEFALKGGDAQSGNLTTLYKGPLPSGYSPMKKQGAIVLGSGGDCCKPGGGANLSEGTFYEGALLAGYPSDQTDDAVQANVIAAGYKP
jgi:hypothetical protein